MRKLAEAPGLPGFYIFRNSIGEKFLISNNTFIPSEVNIDQLPSIPFDITIQGVMDNLQNIIDVNADEIQEAIENFEGS